MGARETEISAQLSTDDGVAVAFNAGQLLEKHRASAKRAPEFLHGLPYVILHDEKGAERIEYVDKQKERPTFRKGIVHLDDAASFIAYVAQHGTPDTAIYAKQDPLKFVAVIDEHPPTANSTQVPAPAWREFRAEYVPAFSKEWDTWIKANRQQFESTEKFAYFLEDNCPDVVEPPGAQLMEVALNFRVNQDVRYSAVQRLQDGNSEITFQNIVDGSSSTAAAGKIRIPEKFVIEVPIFAGIDSRKYRVEARFRFRLHAQGLRLWFELVRPHKTLEQAFADLWTQVGEGTKKTILLGTP